VVGGGGVISSHLSLRASAGLLKRQSPLSCVRCECGAVEQRLDGNAGNGHVVVRRAAERYGEHKERCASASASAAGVLQSQVPSLGGSVPKK
jgi:hypothetical protein